MIPRLNFNIDQPKENFFNFLNELKSNGFSGEISSDYAIRLINSTDNSVYQILPQAVIFPRSQSDIIKIFQLANQERFREISFAGRGGGTGTNGQSLNTGIIIDCSKYMNQILEYDLTAGWVKVQPGVVLDQLNEFLKRDEVFFAPAISPSNRATIGGMVSTDACGEGSALYGKTSNHLLEITYVLVDGTVHCSKEISLSELETIKIGTDRISEIYRQIDNTATDFQELIATQFPDLLRFMTGYDLKHIYSHDRSKFNLNAIIAGSEGTLAIITEIKLRLTPIPKLKRLVVIKYDSFEEGLNLSLELLRFKPEAIEIIDEILLIQAKADPLYSAIEAYLETNQEVSAKAVALVQFVGDELSAFEKTLENLQAFLDITQQNYTVISEAKIINAIWSIRKKSVGLLGNLPGKRKPVSGIEDTVVAPERLASYVTELKKILDRYGLRYCIYGHVDVGCLHVRPALDLANVGDEIIYHKISNEIATLVKKYHGILWGEHGKGFRSQYVELFFGETLYQELRKIKTVFDPLNQLNPGKIVTPFDSKKEVVAIDGTKRGHFDKEISQELREEYVTPLSCNGNGACFNYNAKDEMCPSYKATRDRIHSPKGRASLMREWLRQITLSNSKKNTLRFKHTKNKYDFSHEVYGAMSGCLGCRACATECPVHVNVPEFKAKFFELYFSRYRRPLRDYLIAHIESFGFLQSLVPSLTNSLLTQSIVKTRLIKWFKMSDPPKLSVPPLRKQLQLKKIPTFDLTVAANFTLQQKQKMVVLVQDWVTSYFDADLVEVFFDLLVKLGFQVYLLPLFNNGKALHVRGFLKKFRKQVEKNTLLLEKIADLDIPMIGIDPSITLTYRHEYVEMLSPQLPRFKIQLIQEWLREKINKGDVQITPVKEGIYYLLSHCTEKTSLYLSESYWIEIFAAFGLTLIPVQTGCCGMAGLYGHEAEHQEESKKLYAMSWQEQVMKYKNNIVATGFSCREQIKRLENFRVKHPIEILLES